MSTSVTNPSKKRFKKTAISYSCLTLFLFIASRIYESFSFGESSVHMHYLFAVPLIGGLGILVIMRVIPNLSRLSLNLWNSAVATITAGVLFRGIVNLSGRSTTMDLPYWYVGLAFVLLALVSLVFTRSVWMAEEPNSKSRKKKRIKETAQEAY